MSRSQIAVAGGAGIAPPTSNRARLAKALRGVAGTLLVLVPGAMVFANRSSPLLVTLAALVAALVILAEKRWRAVLRQARAALLSPLGLALLAFVAWAAASLAWSESPRTLAAALGEALLPAIGGLVLALGLAGQFRYFSPTTASVGLAAGLVAACGIIVLDLALGMELQRRLGVRADPFVLNRPVLTVLVIGVPVLWWLARGRHLPRWAIAAAGSAIAGTTIFYGQSGAAVIGLLGGLVVFILARALPRLTVATALLAAGLALATAPVVGELLSRAFPQGLHARLTGVSSEARIQIWRSYGATVREQPLIGLGFGVSPEVAQTAVVQRIPPQHRPMLAAGHPHNAALQIWVETGAVGAALAFLAFALLLRALARMPAPELAPRLALVAGAGFVALVGHGAWQGWWIAGIAVAATLFRFADEETLASREIVAAGKHAPDGASSLGAARDEGEDRGGRA